MEVVLGPLTKDGGGYTPNNHGGIRLAERGYTRRSGHKQRCLRSYIS